MVNYESAILTGVGGWLFALYLTDQGMIFSFWPRWLYRAPEWVKKPLGGCGVCTAGFWGLWIEAMRLYHYISSWNTLFYFGISIILHSITAMAVAVVLTKYANND